MVISMARTNSIDNFLFLALIKFSSSLSNYKFLGDHCFGQSELVQVIIASGKLN